MAQELTPRREAFALAVASGMSQADAYRASFSTRRMKPETVWQAGSRLLADSTVRTRVRQLRAQIAEETVLKAAQVLNELACIVHSDIAGIMEAKTGRVLLPHELDANTRAAVASFEIDEYGRIKYKFWDKNAAIEKAMKHLGLFERDNSQKPDALTELLKALSGNVVRPGGATAHEREWALLS